MKQKHIQTGSIVFYAIYFVLLAAVLSAIVIALGVLWDFLSRYESSQIYHITNAIEQQLNSGDFSLLYDSISDDISPYENETMLKKQLAERFSGEITLKKNLKKSTQQEPVYNLICGESNVGYVSFEVTGKDSKYNLDYYSAKEVGGISPERSVSVEITFPTGCRAEVNGSDILAGTPYKTQPIADAANFGARLDNTPQLFTYTIDELMYEPSVRFFDSTGAEIPAAREGNSYSCALPLYDENSAQQARQFALEFSENYSKYIANDVYFSYISDYIPVDTKLYSDLKTYEGQFYTYHTGYEFVKETVLSVTQYSDDCFAVRVSYDHNVYYAGETFTYPADNTVYAVKTDNGWRAVALVMN